VFCTYTNTGAENMALETKRRKKKKEKEAEELERLIEERTIYIDLGDLYGLAPSGYPEESSAHLLKRILDFYGFKDYVIYATTDVGLVILRYGKDKLEYWDYDPGLYDPVECVKEGGYIVQVHDGYELAETCIKPQE
jgi:hypothetical protein